MKKMTYILFSLLMFAGLSFAQQSNRTSLNVGTVVNIPLSDFGDVATTGWGGIAGFQFKIVDHLSATITSGYLGFTEENNYTYTAVPVMAGLKLYMVQGWYLMAETGWHFYSYDFDPAGTGNILSDNQSEWGYSIGTGYEFDLQGNIGLDISTKYQYNNNNLSYWNSYIGLMFYL